MEAPAYESGIGITVGSFFEDLTKHLLGSKENEGVSADSIQWELDALIEAKASDGNHAWRIKLNQLELYLKQLGFPFESSLYLLWSYRNRSKGGNPRKSELSQLTAGDTKKVHRFLLERVSTLYVIDAEILSAIRRVVYTRHTVFPCQREEHVINLTRSFLGQFVTNGHVAFSQLRLTQAFAVDHVEIALRFRRRQISVLSTLILTPELRERFLAVLKKRGATVQALIPSPLIYS